MSYKPLASKNKHPKVQFEEYLYNFGEPKDDIRRYIPSKIEAVLVDSCLDTKQQFRQLVRMKRKQSV